MHKVECSHPLFRKPDTTTGYIWASFSVSLMAIMMMRLESEVEGVETEVCFLSPGTNVESLRLQLA